MGNVNPAFKYPQTNDYAGYKFLPKNLDIVPNGYKEAYMGDVNDVKFQGIGMGVDDLIATKDWIKNPALGLSVDQNKVQLALEQWKYVIDLSTANYAISFAYSTGTNLPTASSGVTYVGANNRANEFVIFFNSNLAADTGPLNVNTANLSIGTWGGWTAMHELGHVLGLLHPEPGISESDDLRFTIMAYPRHFDTGRIALTPGMDDIAALQAPGKFGQSKAQDGNTNYVFGQGSVDLGHGNLLAGVIGANLNKYVMTMWDRPTTTDPLTGKVDTAGGIDTIDASSLATKTYIDLRAGHFSAIGTDINTPLADGDNGNTDYNVGIAKGAEIENAKGGAVDDYIRGNDLANVLEGNGGNDTLQGGVGNDTLDGGSGFDTYILEGLFKMATIKDNDGQGSITLDSHAIFGASRQILQDIYHDEGPGKKNYIKLSDGGLLVAGAGGEQNIYIQQWNSNNLGISLSGEVATPTGNVMNGDYKTIMHYKTLSKQACKPISMRVAEHLFLFNQDAQKTPINNNEWRLAA